MGIWGRLFESVTDLEQQTATLKNRAYGIIEIRDQEFHSVSLRPFPKVISRAAIVQAEQKKEANDTTSLDRVQLFYNQPMFHKNFLALKYLHSTTNSSLPSIAVALSVLDYIAMVKRTDAIVSEITNDKIKDRHLKHFGWESHVPNSPKRHWIKRLYGKYPDRFLFQGLKAQPQQTTTEVPVPLSVFPSATFPNSTIES